MSYYVVDFPRSKSAALHRIIHSLHFSVCSCAMLVAVHCGAGYHHRRTHAALCSLMKRACHSALQASQLDSLTSLGADINVDPNLHSCLRAGLAAMHVLEESELTNAGKGSALTMCGHVECDASTSMVRFRRQNTSDNSRIVDQIQHRNVAIGCLRHCPFPSTVATRLLLEALPRSSSSSLNSLRDQRTPPQCLVGDGALQWARSLQIPSCSEALTQSLITSHTQLQYHKYRDAMAAESASNSNESVDEVDAKRRRTIAGLHFDSALDSQSTSALEDLNRKNHGTVGAIVYDSSTGVCFAFCSTGGIWMKQAGRLGHAGVPGLACRADVIQSPDNHTWLLASSLSGSGEQIMEFDYARSLKSRFEQSLRAEDDSHSSWASSTLQAFVDQELQCKRHAGCIAIDAQLCDGNRVTLSVSHSTSEFGFGFISSSMTEPFVRMSSLLPGMAANEGRVVQHSDYHIKLDRIQAVSS